MADVTNPIDQETVKRALANAPGFAGKTLDVQRIHAGITNLNWLVTSTDDNRRYFAKIPGQGTEIFIDRSVAMEAAIRAAETGYGPAVIYVAPDMSIEVHEFLEGFRSCTITDMLDPEVRTKVIEAYRALHAAEPLSHTHTGFDQLRERYAQARQYGARIPRDIEHLIWQCGRAEAAINASGIDPCLCFNDAYVTNYMVDDKKNVKIIDWEYATNNDAYWDLGLYCAEMFFDGTDIAKEIIEIHDGKYTAQAEARTTLYYGVALTTWGLWASLQATLSSLPFDFAKYSELLHLRVRHQMSSPRWEQALRAV